MSGNGIWMERSEIVSVLKGVAFTDKVAGSKS